jgi:hypothetical protein
MKLRFLYGVGGEDISEFTKKFTQTFFYSQYGFKKSIKKHRTFKAVQNSVVEPEP